MGKNAKIRALAMKLPPYPDPMYKNKACLQVVTGEQLLAMGKEFVNETYFNQIKNREEVRKVPISAHKKYTTQLHYVPIDHFKTIRAMHNAGGPDMVKKYIEKVMAFHGQKAKAETA